MAQRRGFDDETLPVSIKISATASRGTAPIERQPRGFDDVAIPVTITIPMTPELRAHLARSRSEGPSSASAPGNAPLVSCSAIAD